MLRHAAAEREPLGADRLALRRGDVDDPGVHVTDAHVAAAAEGGEDGSVHVHAERPVDADVPGGVEEGVLIVRVVVDAL